MPGGPGGLGGLGGLRVPGRLGVAGAGELRGPGLLTLPPGLRRGAATAAVPQGFGLGVPRPGLTRPGRRLRRVPDQAWMSTGEPGGSRAANFEIEGLDSRTQPWVIALPRSELWFVPWRAIWPSPVPNWSSTSE
jgi:hypothetical protein